MLRRSFFTRCVAPTVSSDVAKFLSAHWNVGETQCGDAFKQADALGFGGSQAIRKRVAFLIAKGVADRPDPKWVPSSGAPKLFYNLITDPAPNKQWALAQKTLEAILDESPGGAATGQSSSSVIPDDISFATFCKKHPEWADPSTSFVFFRDHPVFGGNATQQVLVQREQLFGTCAIHAPVVMQHYLVAMANPGKKVPTVDISAWLRKKASAVMLEGVVFGNGQHGPLLLAGWQVDNDFKALHLWQHVTPLTKPATFVANHSMLVVGSRCVQGSGEIRLLLQNWWHAKQFVEVGEEYYTDCVAFAAIYVTAPQPHIPPDLTTTDGMHCVSTVDGAGVSGWGPGPTGRPLL